MRTRTFGRLDFGSEDADPRTQMWWAVVGAVVLVAIFAVVAGLYLRPPGADRYMLEIPESGGLAAGDDVRIAPKLEAAVDVVGPWLTRMEYTSTARLLAAEVSETDGDTFVVQVFVDMTSRSKQTPEGVAATATYTVTMDRASDWTITDVGGVGAGLPGADGAVEEDEDAAGGDGPRAGGR